MVKMVLQNQDEMFDGVGYRQTSPNIVERRDDVLKNNESGFYTNTRKDFP